jgi:hypothetical protein
MTAVLVPTRGPMHSSAAPSQKHFGCASSAPCPLTVTVVTFTYNNLISSDVRLVLSMYLKWS